MTEFLQNLNLQDLWTLLVGFMSLNGATIIGLIIAWAKGKIKHGMEIEKIKAEAHAETEIMTQECANALDRVSEVVKGLELRINEALHVAAEEEKKALEEQSIRLSEVIKETKNKALNLTDEIEKL